MNSWASKASGNRATGAVICSSCSLLNGLAVCAWPCNGSSRVSPKAAPVSQETMRLIT